MNDSADLIIAIIRARIENLRLRVELSRIKKEAVPYSDQGALRELEQLYREVGR